ncbi:MAG: PIN domain-containing protein [Bacteroidota bacterium]
MRESQQKCNIFKILSISLTYYHFSESIVAQTISLRKHHKIKLPDAIIAATALVHNLTLITSNTADFHRVRGLGCLDAHLQ